MPNRRSLIPLALIAAALPAAAANATLLRSTKVRLVACETALSQSNRFAVFEGEMRSIAGASRMQVRLQLQARTPDRVGWTRVPAPGFSVWNSASSGVRKFVYTKRVENLFAPAEYRVVVKYRWLNGSGEVVRSDERRTPVCDEPDLRPNLEPLSIDVEPGSNRDTRTYLVPVINGGETDAASFSITLTVNGQAQPVARVSGLPAGVRTMLALEAPACTQGSTLTADVDTNGVVDEADEADNKFTATCPSSD